MGQIKRMVIYNQGYNDSIDNMFIRIRCKETGEIYRRVMIRRPADYSTPAKIKTYNQAYAAGSIFAKGVLNQFNGDVEKAREYLEDYKRF